MAPERGPLHDQADPGLGTATVVHDIGSSAAFRYNITIAMPRWRCDDLAAGAALP